VLLSDKKADFYFAQFFFSAVVKFAVFCCLHYEANKPPYVLFKLSIAVYLSLLLQYFLQCEVKESHTLCLVDYKMMIYKKSLKADVMFVTGADNFKCCVSNCMR
jgi:hypothetical protein